MSVKRKLAAVMFTDIVGFTKIMTESEDAAISILKAQDDIFTPLLEKFSGNLLKKMGDGLLVEFSSAVNAVDCALNIQAAIKEYNKTDGNEFHIRIGIHLGDVLMLGDDILGDGVNIASRIEPLAAPDGICITEAVQQSIKSKLKIDAKRISEVDLKHIDDKYTIYKVPNIDDEKVLETTEKNKRDNHSSKIKMINQDYEGSLMLTFLKGPFKFMSLAFSIGFLIGYIPRSISEGSFSMPDFTRLLSLLLSIEGAITITIILLFMLVSIRRKLKITFDDIRDVENVLEMLITSMSYSFVDKKNGYLEYTHTMFEPDFITKIKLSIPWARKTESLKISFDGNNLIVEGLYMHLNKLSKTLKKYTINI